MLNSIYVCLSYLLFTKKDLLFSNDVDTLLPNYIISKLQNKKLVFDSHELFSEIPELVHKKRVKNVWLFLEKTIIPKLQTVITVSDSIKKHYQNLYGISAIVVRNIPEIKTINPKEFKIETKGKKNHFIPRFSKHWSGVRTNDRNNAAS
jgi:hypothetical protein